MAKKDQGKSDDSDLFKHAMDGTRQINQDRVEPYKPGKKSRPIKRKTEENFTENSSLSDHAPEQVESNEALLFKRSGIQNSVIKKLKKGQYEIEAQLDLHRLIVAEARELLAEFLNHASENNFKCVRIIHGKGLGSPDKLPKLKSMVNSWLKQREDVLAFCSAAKQDGGTGAVYVLLKSRY